MRLSLPSQYELVQTRQEAILPADDPSVPYEEQVEARRQKPGDHISSADVWEPVIQPDFHNQGVFSYNMV
jgi:hypothetical protein